MLGLLAVPVPRRQREAADRPHGMGGDFGLRRQGAQKALSSAGTQVVVAGGRSGAAPQMKAQPSSSTARLPRFSSLPPQVVLLSVSAMVVIASLEPVLPALLEAQLVDEPDRPDQDRQWRVAAVPDAGSCPGEGVAPSARGQRVGASGSPTRPSPTCASRCSARQNAPADVGPSGRVRRCACCRASVLRHPAGGRGAAQCLDHHVIRGSLVIVPA